MSALDLHRRLIPRPASTFLLRIAGDALRDDAVLDGDLVVVDRAADPRPGGLAVVVEPDGLVVRRLSPDPGHPVEVWGMVTAVVRTLAD